MNTKKSFLGTLSSVLTVLALLLALLPGHVSAATPPASDATITFSDGGVSVSGSEEGCKVEGTALTITTAGTYTLTGSCADGSVTVKKGVTGVTLILSNLDLTSSNSATISVNKESAATIYLVGTNSLTDAEDPADETSSDAAVADAFDGAAIKVKANASLTITGDGALNVNGSAKNGIKGGDDATVTIAGGTLNIKSTNDAINTNANLTVTLGTLNITAGDDGLHADGTLTIGTKGASDGPTINVLGSNEGLEGAEVILNSGSGTINASDDGINAAADGTASSLTVNGGSWYVNAEGDGLDAGGDSNGDNGTITLNGGTVTVYGSSNNGNSALDAGRGITYNGGTLLAIGMSGMAEAPSGGNVLVFGGSGMGGGMQQGTMPGNTGTQPQMGSMNGGFGGQMGGQPPQMGGMNGGPGGQMGGQSPQMGGMNGQMNNQMGNSQTNGSISITKGSTITIADSSGNVVCTATGVKNANHVVFASSAVSEGETYTLTVDGTAVATATAGAGSTGGMMGGIPGQMNGQMPQQNSTNGGFGAQPPQQNNASSDAQTTQTTTQAPQTATQAPQANTQAPQTTTQAPQATQTAPAAPQTSKVVVSPQRLTVNDTERKAEAYNIGGNNFFKLRDLAMLLSGTTSQFSVDYDASRRTVVIRTGEAYTAVGGELATGKDNSASAIVSTQSIEVNGVKVDLPAYNIGGSNFFKLRDLAEVLGFNVDYDESSNTAIVTSR